MSANLPACPNSLKPIQSFLKIASEHDTRDIVVSYWCRLYALQVGLKLTANKSPEETALLLALMDWLEENKKNYADNEAVTNEVAAQAHLENYGLKLFLYADKQDRASNFQKNVVKAFYTASIIFEVLNVFGEQTEEIAQNQKYAKWKAAYIHTCLKNGEIPVPGPMKTEDDDDNIEAGSSFLPNTDQTVTNTSQEDNNDYFKPFERPSEPSNDEDSNGQFKPFAKPNEQIIAEDNNKDVMITPDKVSKAQKYCKWASSALSYDDIKTAITNLQKALKLLQTGIDDD